MPWFLSSRRRAPRSTQMQEMAAKLEAIDRSQATIEFGLDGIIQSANANFLAAMGYTAAEIVGRHHRLFIDPSEHESPDYKAFWHRLKQGEYFAAEFRRLGKGGREVWIQASYNPIFGSGGKPTKVVKFATDITRAKQLAADHAAQIAAIGRSQAVIEFTPGGTVLDCNENFLATMGYRREEVIGQHHRMFVEPAFGRTAEYGAFWTTLEDANYVAGEFKRVANHEREVWLQASYNPILDLQGRTAKVVKFATDITEVKLRNADYGGQIAAIGKSQAVIEFALDGTILRANGNFLAAVGYEAEEVEGQHHRMFVEPAYARSAEYRTFWDKLGKGGYLAGEFSRVGKDGRKISLQASYNPILDLNGRPFKVVKYASDITAEVERRATFNLLSLVANETDNAVIITGADRKITYVNRGFERLTGYQSNEVLGRDPGKLLQGPHTDKVTVARVRARLAAGEPFYEEILNYDKAQRPYWISLAINPVRDANGKLDRYISVQANVTQSKQQSQDFNAKLAAISSSSAMAEWRVDGKPLQANAMIAGDGEFTLPLSAVLNQAALQTVLREGSLRRELAWPSQSAPELWLDSVFSVLRDLEGRPSRILMYGSNVTARRAAVTASTRVMREMMERITGVVQSISGFARQTNLLALNAAIEAARAHEAGRGFALVSQEIRKLAVEAGRSVAKVSTLVQESEAQITMMEGSSADTDAVREAA